MNNFRAYLMTMFLLLSLCTQAQDSKMRELFVDSVDNHLDISNWLSTATGFVPVAGIITEPAVGYGGSAGALFVHQKKDAGLPPALTYVGGFYTENKTWGGVVAHVNSWKGDRIRYTGVVGYVAVNLTFYQTLPNGNELPINFSMSGIPFIQKVVARVGDSNFFIGGKYSYFKNEVTLRTPGLIIDIKEKDLKGTVAGLGLVLGLDSRDNIFTPDKGAKAEIALMHNDKYFASDYKYSLLESYGMYFHKTNPRLVSGVKANYSIIWGDHPFYALPFIIMRGVPAMRYQNKQIMQLEVEERWQLKNRWSLVGFGGVGKAYPDFSDWKKYDVAWGVGGGFRYLLAKQYKMHAGIDVARGPEQWTFYFTVGSNWARQ